ncbi:M6 family metalloprotease domain-containing protein [Streptomyces roseifaciens]|uniref:M6 family metalloprotease domain-containing protein n=1 Tax=Streptomyces roseifaciens TaxID=1488406 RepID=UPI000717FBFE|nr:M6 family metalloprotease domain-containing protein [Streptomyces roseifaciens]
MKALAVVVMAATALAMTSPVPAGHFGPGAEAGAGGPPAAGDTGGRPPSGPCALPGATDNVSETARTPPGYARSSGTVRAVTFLIDFPDSPATTTPQARYAEFFPAVADYYRASSYGRLDYRSTPVLRWIRMSRPYAAYGIERGTPFDAESDDGYHAIAAEILDAVDDTVDFRHYDLINVLVTPGAGPPATEDVRSVTFAGTPTGLTTADGVPFKNVSFIWSRQTGDSPFRVLNHENAHSFGLPDLYYTGRGAALLKTPVGHWDPMDEDWGPSNDFLAWHKWKLGWLAPPQVRCLDGPGVRSFALTPTSVPGGLKLAVVPVSRHTVITLEARAAGQLDHAVCRPGVLITTITTTMSTGSGPVRTTDATPGSKGCYTTDLNVNAALSDAPYTAGQRYAGPGMSVDVLGEDDEGDWQVRVRTVRPRASDGGRD